MGDYLTKPVTRTGLNGSTVGGPMSTYSACGRLWLYADYKVDPPETTAADIVTLKRGKQDTLPNFQSGLMRTRTSPSY